MCPTTLATTVNSPGSRTFMALRSEPTLLADQMANWFRELFLSAYRSNFYRRASNALALLTNTTLAFVATGKTALALKPSFHYYGSVTYPLSGSFTQRLLPLFAPESSPTESQRWQLTTSLISARAYRFWQQKASAVTCARRKSRSPFSTLSTIKQKNTHLVRKLVAASWVG